MGKIFKGKDKSRSKQVRKQISKDESIRREQSKEEGKGGRKLSKHIHKQFI